MEIRIYDSGLMLKGIIENQTSLIWTRKFLEPGDFELHVPITDTNLSLLTPGTIISKTGSKEAGILEDLELEESNTKREITAKGRFLSSYMDRRIIKATYTFTGTYETAMRNIFTQAGGATIPYVEFGTFNGFAGDVSFQATYKNLLDYEEKLSKASNIGFRFRPDFTAKKIYFDTYIGLDRTTSQSTNNRVIFSETYNNLNHSQYRYNDQSYKSMVYVGGEGEGSARTVITVGGGSGLDLREVFADAKDISSDGLTTAEYQALLQQRGEETLDADVVSKSFDCDTGADINFVYKDNYDLGDIVTVKKVQWNITENLRITELQEVYEYGNMTVVPTLGTPLPTAIDWSDN